MPDRLNVLVMGATYGSLLAQKLLLAGHDCRLVCLPQEAELINRDGLRTRIPVKARDELIEIHSAQARGRVSAGGPDEADPAAHDMVALAMQEPQYRLEGVRQLLDRVARARVPSMSIMNMPPLPYLVRLPGVNIADLRDCYADPRVWDGFDPSYLTLASPDPQAFRPPQAPANLLQVSLPTNFKVAAFERPEPTEMLRRMEADIQAVRWDAGDGSVELPVKLRVHDSVFVPLAKWAMLLTGNYRCVTSDGPQSIRDAVHGDLSASGAVYDWVRQLCMALGAAEADLVPFEKYAAAAEGLVKPSSAARALYAGAPFIERVDRLVRKIAASKAMRNETLDRTVELVDARLERNRQVADERVGA